MIWMRTCQECGHKQAAKKPLGKLTDSYRNSKCRKCKSMALDFGKECNADGTPVPLAKGSDDWD